VWGRECVCACVYQALTPAPLTAICYWWCAPVRCAPVGGTESITDLQVQLIQCDAGSVCTIAVLGLSGTGKSTLIGRMTHAPDASPSGTVSRSVAEAALLSKVPGLSSEAVEYVEEVFSHHVGAAFDRTLLADTNCPAHTRHYLPPR
jgi:hypothetical protein